eukprot:gene7746-8587_t
MPRCNNTETFGNKTRTTSRDPRWLRIDVCRDHLAGKCLRKAQECRFAHTNENCTIDNNNKAIVCYDSMQNRCSRKFCKFFHPPYHIKEFLLAFGKALEQQHREDNGDPRFKTDAELEPFNSNRGVENAGYVKSSIRRESTSSVTSTNDASVHIDMYANAYATTPMVVSQQVLPTIGPHFRSEGAPHFYNQLHPIVGQSLTFQRPNLFPISSHAFVNPYYGDLIIQQSQSSSELGHNNSHYPQLGQHGDIHVAHQMMPVYMVQSQPPFQIIPNVPCVPCQTGSFVSSRGGITLSDPMYDKADDQIVD